MVEFSVKEVARQIDTSTQYVYQQMDYLMGNSLAYRNDKNKPIVYDKGVEYLKNKRINNLQVANKGLQNNGANADINVDNSNKNEFASNQKTQEIVEIYKKLYEEQKQETNHWKELYIEKDKALTEITSKFLLDAGSEETPKKRKWFWNR